ncbi:MAG: S41 family peptidase [Thermoflexales bacterium]|nr:S41 family peptidase [Thermoflexales bacterium]
MDNSGQTIIKIALATVLAVTLVCGAYGAGFGSGYYAHSALSQPAAGSECPPVDVDCPVDPDAVDSPWDASGPTRSEEQAFQVFWEVWTALQELYYGDLPEADAMVDGAIRGMLQTLDDEFTSYIEPDLARVISEDASGSFEGIGAMVGLNDDKQVEISQPFQGQPAEQAGVRAGDVVVAVDGQSIVGYGLYEAIGLIRGPAGTQVTLTIVRAGEPQAFDVVITRAKIEIPIVEYELLPGDIAYVRLYEFSEPATERTRAALKELLAGKPQGLIFDLRDNPGGYLQQSIDVSDLFLETGIIAIERGSDEDEEIFRASSRGIAQDIPMVVLINAGSASASEIVAGALQDNDRAKLIGETTFGKGSVQMPYKLLNGGELRVTIARWFTPDERAIHDEGLQPDIEVAMTVDDYKAGRDPQRDRAVEYLTAGK